MRFRSILLLGVSSVALQHADAQTAGVNGVPGSTVIFARQIHSNRPIFILPGNPANTPNSPTAPTGPTAATPIYMPPSPFGPSGQLPLMTGGLPGYNAPLQQMPFGISTAKPGMPGASSTVTTSPIFGANAPIVGQSPSGFGDPAAGNEAKSVITDPVRNLPYRLKIAVDRMSPMPARCPSNGSRPEKLRPRARLR